MRFIISNSDADPIFNENLNRILNQNSNGKVIYKRLKYNGSLEYILDAPLQSIEPNSRFSISPDINLDSHENTMYTLFWDNKPLGTITSNKTHIYLIREAFNTLATITFATPEVTTTIPFIPFPMFPMDRTAQQRSITQELRQPVINRSLFFFRDDVDKNILIQPQDLSL